MQTTPNTPTTMDALLEIAEDALLEDTLLEDALLELVEEVPEHLTSDLPDLPDPLHDEDY